MSQVNFTHAATADLAKDAILVQLRADRRRARLLRDSPELVQQRVEGTRRFARREGFVFDDSPRHARKLAALGGAHLGCCVPCLFAAWWIDALLQVKSAD